MNKINKVQERRKKGVHERKYKQFEFRTHLFQTDQGFISFRIFLLINLSDKIYIILVSDHLKYLANVMEKAYLDFFLILLEYHNHLMLSSPQKYIYHILDF
jgi:hypothetical protein